MKRGRLQVLLVGNYLPDAQPSMQRFASLLSDGLSAAGVEVSVTRPAPLLGRSHTAQPGVRKWLGYVDKYVVFPPALWRTAAARRSALSLVHICDHSNAPYVRVLGRTPHIVTCHDLLAVRAARDEFPNVRIGRTGRRLQQAIEGGLRRSSFVACDSEATRDDVIRIIGLRPEQVDVIHPAVAEKFVPLSAAEIGARLERVWPRTRPLEPFILHVGGNNWYKNRRGVIDIYARAVKRDSQLPMLVFAGSPLPSDLREFISQNALDGRILNLVHATDDELAGLYGRAELLLFPSLAEGYGWPVLEAMACGCRVVTSRRAPLTELGGDEVHYVNPADADEAAGILIAALREPVDARSRRVAAGLDRVKRFRGQAMTAAYLNIYQRLIHGD